VGLTEEQQKEVERLRMLLAETEGLSADDLLARRAIQFRVGLGYDPLAAVNIDLIQASALALNPAELDALH
jgi:hypothetical protein